MRCHPSTYSAYSTMERCQVEKELSAKGEEVSDEATQPELTDRLYRYHQQDISTCPTTTQMWQAHHI